jgi:hypothetical protein
MGSLKLASVRALGINNIPITYPSSVLIISNPIPMNRHATMKAVPACIKNVIGYSSFFARFLPATDYPFVIDDTTVLLLKSMGKTTIDVYNTTLVA